MNPCPAPFRRAASLQAVALLALIGSLVARADGTGPLQSQAISPASNYGLLDLHRQKTPTPVPSPRPRLTGEAMASPWMSPSRHDFSSPRFRHDALLSDKGLIRTELKWALNFPPALFHLLFGASKADVARSLHANRVRQERVRNIHETIDMIAWTDPQRAKAYRELMYDTAVRAR